MDGSGVSITQFAILRALDRNGETPLSRLADELVMERTSLYRTIAPLVEAGAVELTAAPKGRTKLAAVTREGRALMHAAAPNWDAAQASVVGALGPENWKALSETLLQIPHLLKEES